MGTLLRTEARLRRAGAAQLQCCGIPGSWGLECGQRIEELGSSL